MKILAGILAGVFVVAMLVSNFAPPPRDAAKATRDLDATPPSQDDVPQDGATGGATATGESNAASSKAVLPPTALLAQNPTDAKSALAEALKALAAANEDSPAADAALERALEQLQKARDALAQQDACCLHTPEHCPPVKDCVGQDACIVVQLPPIEYSQATYTVQGTYAFATIFSAAAARGVENASIRAMNATRVCPTCNLPHSPTTPCAEAQSGGDAPPPKSPNS